MNNPAIFNNTDNNQPLASLIDWASLPGDWLISTLAGTDIGAYFGFVATDIDGILSIILSMILTPIILFLAIYPFKNLLDTILHCWRHKLRKDRIKCKIGFVVLALFLVALTVKQYPIEPMIQDGLFTIFVLSWIIWFAQGRWLNK
jgi:hypothetical protein